MSLYIDIKYIEFAGVQLEHFKRLDENKWQCRCPICGDSEKDKTLARGYFLQKNDEMFFYCHNEGEGYSLRDFMEKFDRRLFDQYIFEKFKTPIERRRGKKTRKKLVFEDEVLLEPVGLPSVLSLPDNHQAKKYLLHTRGFPVNFLSEFFYCDNFQGWAVEKISEQYKHLSKEHRIIIPIYDQRGKLIGAQGRALESRQLRYITLRHEEGIKLVYGLHKWDKEKLTYVVEGPFDSLFLPNCIAAVGSCLKSAIDIISETYSVPKERFVVVFDNENRNHEIVASMKRAADAGLKTVVWSELQKHKDLNDMFKQHRSFEKILRGVESRTFSGVEASLLIDDWRRDRDFKNPESRKQ